MSWQSTSCHAGSPRHYLARIPWEHDRAAPPSPVKARGQLKLVPPDSTADSASPCPLIGAAAAGISCHPKVEVRCRSVKRDQVIVKPFVCRVGSCSGHASTCLCTVTVCCSLVCVQRSQVCNALARRVRGGRGGTRELCSLLWPRVSGTGAASRRELYSAALVPPRAALMSHFLTFCFFH